MLSMSRDVTFGDATSSPVRVEQQRSDTRAHCCVEHSKYKSLQRHRRCIDEERVRHAHRTVS
jgi:hypothetical protein